MNEYPDSFGLDKVLMVEPDKAPGRRILAWVTLSRLPFHTVGILPFILGMVIACSQGYPLNFPVGILSTFAVILIMLATYYSGEFYDYETDCLNSSFNKFSGGTRILVSGLIPRGQALLASLSVWLAPARSGSCYFFILKLAPSPCPSGSSVCSQGISIPPGLSDGLTAEWARFSSAFAMAG